MDPRVWKVCQELKKYMEPEKRYVLAVSGGADSLALADAAALVFKEKAANLRICHVEHGIRGEEALRDAELVESFCQERGLSFVCHHVEVPKYAQSHNCSIEEAARVLRYEKLVQESLDFGAKAVVTAHQADDQAETILWKFLRGAGADGLSGMHYESVLGPTKLLRPLLALSRVDLEAYCRARNLSYCEDSTNADVTYTRNRIRKELLPYLEREFNPGIKATLRREAEVLAEEQECLQQLAEKYLQDTSFCGIVEARNAFWLNAKALQELPSALRKRILRKAVFLMGCKELSYERTLALDKLCMAGIGGKMVQLGFGLEALYRNKKIFINKGV